jgi:hypothetical protein
MVGGTVTDASLPINVHSSIWPCRTAAAGTQGFPALANIIANSYDVLSDSALDQSTFRTVVLQGGGHEDNLPATPTIARRKLSPHAGDGGLQAGGSTSMGVQIGSVSMVDEGGTATVNTFYVPSGARFMLFPLVAGATKGHLSLANIVPGNPGSFDIVSSGAGDDSVIQFAIIDPAVMLGNNMLGIGEGRTVKALQVVRATLVAGTLAIPATFSTTTQAGLFVQRVTPGGALGHLRAAAPVVGDPGTCTVTSSNAGDTSIVDLFVWHLPAFGRL